MGRAEVDDVLNLVTVANGLGYIHMERMFMLGVSRGGMMTYLALKSRVPVKAAAVIAGPSDLEPLGAVRPDFLSGDADYEGRAKVWPDFEHRKEEYFRARSTRRCVTGFHY
jgi:dipeptidyl aminopeptidase/acylaminoacyl peptidase